MLSFGDGSSDFYVWEDYTGPCFSALSGASQPGNPHLEGLQLGPVTFIITTNIEDCECSGYYWGR